VRTCETHNNGILVPSNLKKIKGIGVSTVNKLSKRNVFNKLASTFSGIVIDDRENKLIEHSYVFFKSGIPLRIARLPKFDVLIVLKGIVVSCIERKT